VSARPRAASLPLILRTASQSRKRPCRRPCPRLPRRPKRRRFARLANRVRAIPLWEAASSATSKVWPFAGCSPLRALTQPASAGNGDNPSHPLNAPSTEKKRLAIAAKHQQSAGGNVGGLNMAAEVEETPSSPAASPAPPAAPAAVPPATGPAEAPVARAVASVPQATPGTAASAAPSSPAAPAPTPTPTANAAATPPAAPPTAPAAVPPATAPATPAGAPAAPPPPLSQSPPSAPTT
jgi:hypothetical protein